MCNKKLFFVGSYSLFVFALISVEWTTVQAAKTAAEMAGKISDILEPLDPVTNFLGNFSSLIGPSGMNIEGMKVLLPYLSKVVGILGPAGAVAGIILSEVDKKQKTKQHDELLREFAKMHERFDDIERKLDHIGKFVGSEITFAQYELNILKPKLSVLSASKTYQRIPDPAAFKALQQQCKSNPPITTIAWLRHTIETDRLGTSLFNSYYTTANFDKRKLHQYVYTLMADITELGVLVGLCAGVGKDPKPTKALLDDYSKQVIETGQAALKQLEKLEKQFATEWSGHAQKELDEKMRTQLKSNPKTIDTKKVFDEIQNKYFFVEMFLAVYDYKTGAAESFGKTYGQDGGYFQFNDKNYKREAMMGWVMLDRAYGGKAVHNIAIDVHSALGSFKECESGADKVSAKLQAFPALKKLNPTFVFVIKDAFGRNVARQPFDTGMRQHHASVDVCNRKFEVIVGF